MPNTVTVTLSGAAPDQSIAIHEYSGLVTSNAFDVGEANVGTSTAPLAGPETTNGTNSDMAFGAFSAFGGGTMTAGSGFTLRQTSTQKLIVTEDKGVIAPSTSGVNADIATTNSIDWGAMLALFKTASGSYAHIQSRSAENGSSASSISLAFNSNVGSTRYIIVVVGYDTSTGATTSSVTDTLGNSYGGAPLVSVSNGAIGEILEIWGAQVPTGDAGGGGAVLSPHYYNMMAQWFAAACLILGALFL